MSSYRETSNYGKSVRRGIVEPKAPTANRKKPRVRGPWKVIGPLLGTPEHIWNHCATQELAEKMLRKHAWNKNMRVEYREAT